jgi:hypothetical protein
VCGVWCVVVVYGEEVVHLGGKVIGGEEGAYVRASNQLLLKWAPGGLWTRQTAVFLCLLYGNLPIRGKR